MFANHNSGFAPYRPPQPPKLQSETLKYAELTAERKFYTVALKENIRGKFLAITEHSGRNSTIVIPHSGLAEFSNLLGEMVKTESEQPS